MLLINRPKIRMSNIFFIVLYLSLIYPQKGCEKIEARGPTANTQPISVPFSPLYCKSRGRKLIIMVFMAWKLKSNVFKGINVFFVDNVNTPYTYDRVNGFYHCTV